MKSTLLIHEMETRRLRYRVKKRRDEGIVFSESRLFKHQAHARLCPLCTGLAPWMPWDDAEMYRLQSLLNNQISVEFTAASRFLCFDVVSEI